MTVSETIRHGFVTGLALLAPLAVTIAVVDLVYGWLVGFVSPLVAVAPAGTPAYAEPLALLALFVVVTAVGVVVRHGVGDTVVARFDDLMETIPGVSAVYSSARQASTALASHEDQFERVALVQWPRSGAWTVGFVAAETPAKLRRELPDGARDETHYDVFVPMAPNPMGGFLAVVPESQLTTTDLSVTEGFQILVTSGLSGDDDFDVEEFADATAARE